MFFWQRRYGPVAVAVTERAGGVSAGPYAALNLGAHVGDDPGDVTANRARLAAALDVVPGQLVVMDQCHGAQVAVVDAAPQHPPRADALVTTTPDLALLALVADCTPVLLWDEDGPAIAAVHAGRPGLVAGVVPAAVSTLRDLGARRLRAIVGPAVCGRCYEVPADMCTTAASLVPAARTVTWAGTPALDIAAGVVAQLDSMGVELAHWVCGCAREDERLFSHRRSGVTGRFAGVILRRSR